MELYEAMSTLRAVRRLKPDPIPDDVQTRILNAATWAPTGGNVQPWRMVVVTDPDKKQALENLYRPYWEAYIPGYEAKMKNMPAEVLASTTRAAGNSRRLVDLRTRARGLSGNGWARFHQSPQHRRNGQL